MSTAFLQHCDSSDTHFTQLNETFDEDYIEEVFKRMCFLREIFSDGKQKITSAQARMKADYDKKKGKPKV